MSLRLAADDDTLRNKFQALKSRDDVADLLEVDSRELRFYLYKAHSYRTFFLKKRSGGLRRISSPANALKIIQRKLNQVLQAVYRARSPVHGFARTRSLRSNAARHLGAEWVLNFDLADFFPSIHFGRVLGMFKHKPYNLPDEAAQTLAQICCYEKSLPAGAPTSPVVANMICARLDAEMKALAKRYGCVYTRYADDITISTKSRRLAPAVAYRDATIKRWVLGDEVRNTIHANLFTVNDKKTRVRNRTSRQQITGVTINAGLNVSRTLVRQVRAMLHAWETYGEAKAEAEFQARYDRRDRRHPGPRFRAVLRGKLEFIGFIKGRDDIVYIRLLNRFLFLDPTLRAQPVVITASAKDAVMAQAIWLLENEDGSEQGTAFAVDGGRLLTASHCVAKKTWASRPEIDNKRHPVTITKIDEVRDVAELSIDARVTVVLKLGEDSSLSVGTPIILLGFPNYHGGDSVSIRRGSITQSRFYIKIPHFLIDADVVKGNSGGPVLGVQNRVVGIAVKGLGTPGIFSQEDQLSSFVPISSLKYLKEVSTKVSSATSTE